MEQLKARQQFEKARKERLIKCMTKMPNLYKPNCVMSRYERQFRWQLIAKHCDFETPEMARKQWRSLLTCLRMHVLKVAAGQLEDWPYYESLKFMVPYIRKRSFTPRPEINHVVEVESHEVPPITHQPTTAGTTKSVQREISSHDQNLKLFFNAILQSTLNLPKFHQERVKQRLLDVVAAEQNS